MVTKDKDIERRHVIAALVDNEFGVLGRVVGLFSGRGYNIESLTVAEVRHRRNLSRITIVTNGSDKIIQQIKSLLERLVPVHCVTDLTEDSGNYVERELMLIKIKVAPETRTEALRLSEQFKADVIDSTDESLVFEISDVSVKLDECINVMRPLGIIEVCRTGVTAISYGSEGMLPASVSSENGEAA